MTMPSVALLLFSSAIVLGTLLALPLAPDVRLLAGGGAVAIAVYATSSLRASPAMLALVLLACASAAANAELRGQAAPLPEAARTARYTGTLVDAAITTDGSTELTIALDGGIRALAVVRSSAPPIGVRAIVRGRLEPFDDARNPGEPSERELQRERGYDARLDGAAIISSAPDAASDARTWLARAHAWARERLSERLGEPDAAVVAGELWGERSGLPPALRAEFQETGTVHVLVTAGLHLGAVAAICLVLLAPLGLPRSATCLITAILIWLFVWWSGAQLPAVRAATMATAALAARACGRATFSWNALGIAAGALALARPESVGTASFALSFSCVGAIFACAGPLERWIETRIALPDRAREALVLSIATQIGTWPTGAAVFLQFAPYAVVANVAVVPCVAATMALGAAQLALAWCAPLAQACANVGSWLLAWMLGVVSTLADLPGATIPMTPAPAWAIAAYDAAVLAAPLLWRASFDFAQDDNHERGDDRDQDDNRDRGDKHRGDGVGRRHAGRTLAVAFLAVAVGWVLWPPRSLDGALRITVLDVGQADAIVIQTPRGHALLVDAGGRLERGPQGGDSIAERVGERIVVPFLLRHGIHAVDALLLSHPHGDHAGGAAPVLRHLRVGALADSGQNYGGHAYRDAIDTARAEGVAIVQPRAGMQWRTDDGVDLQFVGPSLPFIQGGNAINSNSLAFVLTYGHFRMLFTGDAGSESEQRFLGEGVDLHADVLKVGHHGSAYGSSPSFVEAVHPRYAVISVGRHNLFGHPAPSTLDTLERSGARVYRTDQDGAVTILTDGSGVTVSSMLRSDDGYAPKGERRAQLQRRV